MSILQYFKRKEGLPDPRGELSTMLPPRAIASANSEIKKSIQARSKRRGPYSRYSPTKRAAIGKYALENGVAATSRIYSRKLGHNVSATTVRSIKMAFLEQKKLLLENSETHDGSSELNLLPCKPRGRLLLLGTLDSKVQLLLKKIRENGGTVNARIAISAAKGIVMYYNPSLLLENGGHIELTQNWAMSLLERMRRKASTAKSRESEQDFKKKKDQFLMEVAATVSLEDIPAELILNWDQTGIRLVPTSNWTMDKKGSQRVPLTGLNDKRQVTAVLCGNLIGDFLPPQIVYQGTTRRCHPRYEFPRDWDITHSPKHWSTEETMVQYIHNIICPFVESSRDRLNCTDTAALVIIDNFKGQITPACTEILESHKIHNAYYLQTQLTGFSHLMRL